MNNKVLIISNPEDKHITAVIEKIRKYNFIPILFYPENLGSSMFLSFYFDRKNKYPTQKLLIGAERINLQDFKSVWYRRPRAVLLDKYDLSPEGLDFARDEWQTFINNTYDLMDKPLWVSNPNMLKRASNKLLQLKVAKSIGFEIPRTLITNNLKQAKEFVALCKEKIVVKATGKGWVYNSNGNNITYVLTNRLSSKDIENLFEIEASPVTFQEEIPKDFEVRVNIVGQKCLAIKIESQKSELSSIDWRRYDINKTPYSEFILPKVIEEKCFQICNIFGLEFGAIDLIYQPDGKFIFLEVNGNGQFLWAENLSGVKISDALACLLTGNAPSLKQKTFS